MINQIFYLTGYNGSIKNGLGKKLNDEYTLTAIEINDEFLNQNFNDQLSQIKSLLQSFYLSGGRVVIANSMGAYLILHAIIGLSIRDFNILLLSPVLGKLALKERPSFPPETDRLKEAIKKQKLNYRKLKIVGGSDDDIIDFEVLHLINKFLNSSEISIINNQGHQLDHVIVSAEVNKIVNSV
ncbi:alpha/beta hydrolase [Mangrovivirga cuniculi]|uniref:Alpha/beta hydrolase n=1 Tax=Mangrovivirga cuniculi TaxID=2715131 RepID=A0A4D7JRZ0_9BACT|nr:alpha/beta hydrolase [Mangrovivirga cuniculi]QCK16290.1 hypothetical protein DCC35_16865 [Mangrovivirga cuniculi]